jgi:methylmalonyl-CoA mutase N-terminal domain/subunit
MEANKSNIVKRKERKEVFTTSSGIPIKRVYTPEDIADLDYNRDLGSPGEEPFVRGIYPTMYRGRLWTIRQFSGLNSAEDTNKRFKYMYQQGLTGFSIAFDNATLAGLDPDDEGVEFEIGAGGVNVFSMKDMEEMFDGLPIDKVSTAVIPIMWSTCQTTGMYFAMAEKRGIDLKKLDGTTEGDPLSTASCITNPTASVPFRHAFRLCVDLAEWSAINVPKWHAISFTSYNYREAGVNAYQEIAGLMAAAIAVIEEELHRDRGLGVDDFVPQFTFHLSSHSDFFEEIAKMRAARRMWCKIMTERYNAKDPRSKMLRFHIQTAGSSLTYQQPLNNAIRVAYQILAASLSGAQSMHACSYDEALCIPTEESALLSIRTQQIAQHEINVANVVDPLGGSYFVESLTNEVEKKAWDYLGEIEEHGGFVEAVESGWFRAEVEKAQMKREDEVRSGERKVVGVNCFKMTEEPYKVSFFRRDPKLVEKQRAKLQKLKEERDDREVEKALEELRQVTESGENVMPAVMKALKVYTTIGEISKVWKSIFGPIVPSSLAMTM